MKFKSERIENEWRTGKLSSPLKLIIVWIDRLAALCNFEITLTGIYRSQNEQEAIYGPGTKKKSTHQFWRAVDLRTRDLPTWFIELLVVAVNMLYPYGKKGKNTALYHSVGKGWHLHIQVIS